MKRTILIKALVVVEMALKATKHGMIRGIVVGSLYVLISFSWLDAIINIPIGFAIGSFVGSLTGCVVGIVTVLFFHPLNNEISIQKYKNALWWVGNVTAGAILTAIYLIFAPGDIEVGMLFLIAFLFDLRTWGQINPYIDSGLHKKKRNS